MIRFGIRGLTNSRPQACSASGEILATACEAFVFGALQFSATTNGHVAMHACPCIHCRTCLGRLAKMLDMPGETSPQHPGFLLACAVDCIDASALQRKLVGQIAQSIQQEVAC